jgi:hypothetical protein
VIYPDQDHKELQQGMKIYRSMLEELVASPAKLMKGASTESGIAQISLQ